MILNADKTITMNVRFNHRTVFDENVVLSDDTQLKPSNNFWASSSMRDYLLVNMLTILFLAAIDRKSTRLNSSHVKRSRMPSSA